MHINQNNASLVIFIFITKNPFRVSNNLNVIFHRRLSSIKGRPPSMVSSIEGRLPSKVVFHRRSSSIKGRLPLKVVFHQRSSSFLPPEQLFSLGLDQNLSFRFGPKLSVFLTPPPPHLTFKQVTGLVLVYNILL